VCAAAVLTRDTLLSRRDKARQARGLVVRSQVRRDLRAALHAPIPGERVWVFGSLTQPGRFNEASDVDVALEAEPAAMSAGRLWAELSERLARHVDVVLLETCRFRDKIQREGELWML
jgi:predicted nucleotidyltransferase